MAKPTYQTMLKALLCSKTIEEILAGMKMVLSQIAGLILKETIKHQQAVTLV